jgi:hypothetical protein
MLRMRKIVVVALAGAVAGFISTAACAQGTFADKAVKLEGIWVTTDGSRTIEFAVRNNAPIFEDAVRPGIKMSGGYGAGQRGAAYELRYPESLSCSYNIAFPSQEKGNEMIMMLVRAEPKEQAHRCIVGTVKRSR